MRISLVCHRCVVQEIQSLPCLSAERHPPPPAPAPSVASPHSSYGAWGKCHRHLMPWFLSYLWELHDLGQVSSIALALFFPLFL